MSKHSKLLVWLKRYDYNCDLQITDHYYVHCDHIRMLDLLLRVNHSAIVITDTATYYTCMYVINFSNYMYLRSYVDGYVYRVYIHFVCKIKFPGICILKWILQ